MTSPDPSELEALFNTGRQHFEDKELDKALSSFETLTQLDPEAPAGYFFLGLTLGALARHEEALNAFEAAAQIAPEAPPILFFLGVEHVWAENWAQAIHILTRYIDLTGSSEEFRAILLLGFSASQLAEVDLGFTVEEYLLRDVENERDGEYEVDFTDPFNTALFALAAAAQGVPEGAAKFLGALAEEDDELAEKVAPALGTLALWYIENRAGEEENEEDDEEYEDDELEDEDAAEWEEENAALLSHLARFDHFHRNGIEPPPEAFEELFHAFKSAALLVPTEDEIHTVVDDDGNEQRVINVMLRPEEEYGGHLVSVAFTGRAEAREFFGGRSDFHSVIMPGDTLADMLASVMESLEAEAEDEKGIRLVALMVNWAGPHGFAFGAREIKMLAKESDI